jgi:8-oxo-dGTP pyrophosphatase MutT (NUDIX family)
MPQPTLRNSAKALIIRDGHLLAQCNQDDQGPWYLLPGGGQHHGEDLHEALKRECREEISCDITIGPLRFIREYIGAHHEFRDQDSHRHQIEFMFECQLNDGQEPCLGHEPDCDQVGIEWLPLARLAEYRLYPSGLRTLLRDGLEEARGPVYLGDCN